MNSARTIDPRIKLTLLPIIGFVSFFISDTILLFVILSFSFLLYIYSRIYKKAFYFLAFFSLLLGLEYGMVKISDYDLVFALYMMIFFLSRMTLIAMFGARFFDPSFTFVERGVSFLVLGIIVLGINAIYLWRKGKQRATMNQRVRQARRQVTDVSALETPMETQVVTEETKTVESEVAMKEEER